MGENFALSGGLIALCVVYTGAAANEYWLMNWLKSDFDIALSIFPALLQNASWPLQIVFYARARAALTTPRVVSEEMYRSYIVLGLLSAFITLTRTMGIVSLPATIYAIVANTEIVFESFMTRFILKRPVSKLQMLAVALVIAGVMISLYDPHTGTFGENDNVSKHALFTGIILSLASRFASSLNTVLADKYYCFSQHTFSDACLLSPAACILDSLEKMPNRAWEFWNVH